MRIRRVATAALIALLACSQVQARTLDQVPPYLEKEGKFVSYPALGMGAVGILVGTVIALPASLIALPIGMAAGDPLGYALVPPSVVATAGAEAGYHVGGALPWLLKNGFYDAPMGAVARIKGEPASGLVAQVEPPPAHNGDIQYLESTPPAARVPVVLARQYSSALPPPKPPTSLMLRRQLSPFKPPPLPVKGAAAKAPPPPPAPRPAPYTPPAAVAPVAPPPAVVAPSPAFSAPEPVAALPPTVVAPPPEVAPPPAVAPPPEVAPVLPDVAPPPVVASSSLETAPQPEVAPVPAVEDAPATATDGETDDRPAIKKKKRKFSERFGF